MFIYLIFIQFWDELILFENPDVKVLRTNKKLSNKKKL